jgi:hypothetical protein
MYIELAAAAFLAGQYIYHRLTEKPPPEERGEFTLPITEEGAPRAKIFGRDRVRQPVLEWTGDVSAEAGSIDNGSPTSPAVYRASTLLSLGTGFGNGTNNVHGLWFGDVKLATFLPPLAELPNHGAAGKVHGLLEILLGGPTQTLVDGSGAGTNATGLRMRANGVDADKIGGYRKRMSVFLYNTIGGFYFGASPSFPAVNIEASSYQTNHPQLGTFARVGDDSNPVNVLHEILTGTLDMLGLPESLIDIPSFQAAQYTLHTESHGYSRVWDQRASAADIIMDVLRQIDGILFEDQTAGKVKLKLIRADYDPNTIPVIDRHNCDKIMGFAMNSRVNVVNRVRVVYENREKNYDDDSAMAIDMANVVGQDGQVVEEVIEYRGCKRANQAFNLAQRELEVLSKPLVKCRARVGRWAIRINPGDPVKVLWNAPDINAVFRVMHVERGTLEDGAIDLDLVLDPSYVWRNQTPIPPGFGGIDRPPVTSGGG